jgi:hypothetical protein
MRLNSLSLQAFPLDWGSSQLLSRTERRQDLEKAIGGVLKQGRGLCTSFVTKDILNGLVLLTTFALRYYSLRSRTLGCTA